MSNEDPMGVERYLENIRLKQQEKEQLDAVFYSLKTTADELYINSSSEEIQRLIRSLWRLNKKYSEVIDEEIRRGRDSQ